MIKDYLFNNLPRWLHSLELLTAANVFVTLVKAFHMKTFNSC